MWERLNRPLPALNMEEGNYKPKNAASRSQKWQENKLFLTAFRREPSPADSLVSTL